MKSASVKNASSSILLSFQKNYSAASLSEDLHAKSNSGWFLRGCRESLARSVIKWGGEILPTCQSASIVLQDFSPSKSLLALGRRGRRQLAMSEVSGVFAAKVEDSIFKNSRYADRPRLQYLFQTTNNRHQRFFVGSSLKSGQPLLLISMSENEQNAWHLELILRDKTTAVGSMEFALLELIAQLSSERAKSLSLGEVPFVGAFEGWEPARLKEKALFQACKTFGKSLSPAYNSNGLFAFKNKFNPIWETTYCCAYPKLRIRDMLAFGTKTNCFELAKWASPFGKQTSLRG